MKVYQKENNILRFVMIAAIIFVIGQMSVMAQTTAFNFQGRLNDGTSPANGKYDLQFRLYDALTGGTQIGSTISQPGTTIINGVYSTQLDFLVTSTTSAFYYDNNPKFIEVSLRPMAANVATSNAFTILGPRQQILFVPFAVRSLRAASAEDAINSRYALLADNAGNALTLGGLPAEKFVQQDTNGSVSRRRQSNNFG